MADTATAVAQSVVQGLMARSFESNPELRDPLPMTPEEVEVYAAQVRSLSYPQLVRAIELMNQAFTAIKDSLPEDRLNLMVYPHPMLQRRLVLMNEFYRRSVESPRSVAFYNMTKTTFEWGLAGGLIGGAFGYFFVQKKATAGALAGMVLGALAGRSEVVQRVFVGFASNIAAM
jgi:hypothetical protein